MHGVVQRAAEQCAWLRRSGQSRSRPSLGALSKGLDFLEPCANDFVHRSQRALHRGYSRKVTEVTRDSASREPSMQLETNLFTLRTPTALDHCKYLFRWMSTFRCSTYSPIAKSIFESQLCMESSHEGSTLKVHPGQPHGMRTTNKDQINEGLFAFIKSQGFQKRRRLWRTHRLFP